MTKITIDIGGPPGSEKLTAAVAIARALYAEGFNIVMEHDCKESFADQPVPTGLCAKISVERDLEP